MDLIDILLMTLGIGIGMILSHRFIFKRDWEDSIIIGCIVAIIFFTIMSMLLFFGIIGITEDYRILI